MIHFVQFCGHRVKFRFYHCAGFIHKVDGLIRQEAIGDIAVGQRRGGNQRSVLNLNAVVDLVALLQAAQDRDGVLDGRLVHHDRLETAFQCRVFLDILAVLVEGRRADAVQLTARQHGLEQVARIHRAVGLARADDGVQFIDEEDDLALGLLDLVQDALQALLELAAVFCARDQRAHVQAEHGAVFQVFGHVAAHDTLGKAFGDSRLADAGLTDEHGVVLALTAQDTDDVADLAVTADDGVKFVGARHFDKVLAVLFQRVVGVFRVITRHPLIATYRAKLLHEFLSCQAESLKNFIGRLSGALQNSEKNVFNADVLILHLLGLLFGSVEGAVKVVGDINFLRVAAGAGHTGQCLDLLQSHLRKGVRVDAKGLQHLRDQPVLLLGKGGQQVLLLHRVVGIFHRDTLCSLQSLTGFLCHLFDVHSAYLL